MEFPSNFEQFTKNKTIENVVAWIEDSITATRTQHADYCQFVADGASNAIGSVAELEAQTRTRHSNDIGVTVCFAHQNEWSGAYARGMGDFAEPVNAELGDILRKSHEIQVSLLVPTICLGVSATNQIVLSKVNA